MLATEEVFEAGVIAIETPWYTETAKVLYSIDRLYVVCETEANCGTKVLLRLKVSKWKGINPDTLIIKMKTISKSQYCNIPDSHFYCLRCKNIYDRSFARQKGSAGGNKCKNCYNLGRIEERNNNIQAKLRARLHCGLKGMLDSALKGEIKKLNRAALVRYIKNKYNYKRPYEVRNRIKEVYGIDIGSGASLYCSFKTDAPEHIFKEVFLGCTRRGLVLHIESQFEDGWNWDNMGEVWEIDHVKPYNDFDLTDEKQVREVMHYTNIRPLSVKDNRKKRSKCNM